MKKKAVISTIICILLIAVAGYSYYKSKSLEPVSKTGFGLDTVISITLYGKSSENEKLLDNCFELINHYESLFSTTIEGSDIYIINHSGGKEISVDTDTYELVKVAVSYAEMSGGLVDPTIGSVSSLWDFHAESPKVPSDELIKEALSHVDYKKISFNNSSCSICLEDPDSKLDLGFIAKGYIADRLKEMLLDNGVKTAIINLGGNVLVIGSKPDGNPFKIGIQDPFGPTGSPCTSVEISDSSVVSSGSYERTFEIDGKKYHHILDTKTGYPIESDLASVSVISKSSLEGDALSTYLFILGNEKAKEFDDEHEDIELLLIPNP